MASQQGYGTILCHGDLPENVDRLFAPMWQLEEALKFHGKLGLKLTPEEAASIEGLLAKGKVLPTLPLDEKIRSTDPWLAQVKKWEADISRRVGSFLYDWAEECYDKARKTIDRLGEQGYKISLADCFEAVELDTEYKALFAPDGVHPTKITAFTEKVDRFTDRLTQRFEANQSGPNTSMLVILSSGAKKKAPK